MSDYTTRRYYSSYRPPASPPTTTYYSDGVTQQGGYRTTEYAPAEYTTSAVRSEYAPRSEYTTREYTSAPREYAPAPVHTVAPQYREFTPTVAPSAVAQPATVPRRLYLSRVSANCLGPWLLMREADIPFDIIDVDIAKGETHTPEFLTMNPMGKVPTYVEADGSVLWESNAIMRYICEKHRLAEQYYPGEVNLRGRVEMALDWRNTVLYPNIAKVAYPYLGFSKDNSKIAEGKTALDKDLKVLSDFFLRETPFIGGPLPCIADFSIGLPLLLLYATDYRLPAKVREYLEHLASKCPHWNDVTEALKNYMSSLK